jgi:hypothetical protein
MPMREQIIDLQFIAGDTLVTALESLAFKGRWILPNLVGGVDQVRDIDRAVLLKKS